MAEWTLVDYIETTGRNPIREWLDDLPEADQAKIDDRLLAMGSLPKWPEKWVSKYQGTREIYELRVSGNKVEYRPLGTYFGKKRFVILAGAIERGDRIPQRDIETAKRRLDNLRSNKADVVLHEFDSAQNMEENEE